MWNFRIKQHLHTVRAWAEREVRPGLSELFEIQESINEEYEIQDNPYDDLMRIQTGGRHMRGYYESLKRLLLCASFGGWFILPRTQEEAGPLCLFGRKLINATRGKTMAIAQWDSWRLWEAFAAGAVVLHVDFEKHGFLLPGPLPSPMKHYVAVDLYDSAKSLRPILEDVATLRQIAAAGRKWAIEHYASTPIALRLINRLMSIEPTSVSTSLRSQVGVPHELS
jgi:hypothetical protein